MKPIVHWSVAESAQTPAVNRVPRTPHALASPSTSRTRTAAMPEGPEIYMASRFINTLSRGRTYGGQVVKSEVSTKNPDVEWAEEHYRVSATARGKELKVTLHEGQMEKKNEKTLDILIRFGMSGGFKFTRVDETPKHAHLRFYTVGEDPPMVLSFVDYRRFGRWEVGGTWGSDRGPDPMWEYPSFRENILSNLKNSAFNKPICETMLNQKFFNGIGNYLRAEILFRCCIAPFDEAREVLSEVKPFSKWYESSLCPKSNGRENYKPDILDLCHIVPKEVINLEGKGKGYNVDLEADEDDYKAFREWLQCYNQEEMENMVDHNGRTMWFTGNPGKLVPKKVASRGKKNVQRKKGIKDDGEEMVHDHKVKKIRVKGAVKEEVDKEDLEQVKMELKEEIKKETLRRTGKNNTKLKDEKNVALSNRLAQKMNAKKIKQPVVKEKKDKKMLKTKSKNLKRLQATDSLRAESPVRRSKRLGSTNSL